MSLKDSPTLFLECTPTIRTGLNTGIQRVVRALIDRVAIFEQELGMKCVPIAHQIDWLYTIEDAKRMTHDDYLNYPKIKAKEGDILLVIDAYWSFETIGWLPYFQSKGNKIFCVLYDFIPSNYPEFFTKSTTDNFESKTIELLKASSLAFCISRRTFSDAKKFMQKTGVDCPLEIFNISPRSDLVELDYGEKYTVSINTPYFLQVGTIEPRRNTKRVLEEFKKIWDSGNQSGLLLVGKQGENSDEIITVINSLIADGYPLIWKADVDDYELAAYYLSAEAVIVASFAEGYGLPVAEGLLLGRPVIANNLEVFHEVADNCPSYFNIDEEGELANLILNRRYGLPGDCKAQFITWDESVQQLTRQIRRACQHV
jgi:glycosyltransferase involved in cell wall biosynthesis